MSRARPTARALWLVAALALAPALAAADPPLAPAPPSTPAAPAASPAGASPGVAVPIDTGAAEAALDQVVVLAARRPQPLREAAASTSIITAGDLAAYGWRDFAEAIASLAGIYTTSPGDAVYLGVRGISLRGDENGRILILVDGHTQNELWSHSAYPDQMGLDATLIDHIEVLRGPASSLYGSLGFLAIVNIVTRRGAADHWARASFDLEDAYGYRAALSVGHRFRGGLEFGVSASARKSLGVSFTYPDLRGLVDARCPSCASGGVTSTPESDASEGLALYAYVTWKGLSLKGSWQYLDQHVPFAPYGTEFNSPVNHFLTTRGYVDLGWETGRPEQLQLQVRGYFDTAGYADDLRYAGDPSMPTATGGGDYTFHDEANPYWAGAELKLLATREWRDLRASLTAGGDVTWLHGDDLSGRADDIAAHRTDAYTFIRQDILFGSAYGQAELSYARALALTLGLRGDFSDTYPSELSPRAGLVLFPSPSTTVKALYAHGFIHPSWYQTFFNDHTSILDDRSLGPERADNYELLVQQQLGRALLVQAGLFYIHGDRLIEQVPVCADGGPVSSGCADTRLQFQNARSFESRGGEIALTGRFSFGLRLFANYTLAYARDGDGFQAVNSPRHLVKTGLVAPLWRNHLFVGAEARAWSARRLEPGQPEATDAGALVSAHVAWRDLPKGLSVLVKVYDLTGQTLYEPSVAEDSHPIARIPHPGPTVITRIGYEY